MELRIYGDQEYIQTIVDAEGKIFIIPTKKFIEKMNELENLLKEKKMTNNSDAQTSKTTTN